MRCKPRPTSDVGAEGFSGGKAGHLTALHTRAAAARRGRQKTVFAPLAPGPHRLLTIRDSFCRSPHRLADTVTGRYIQMVLSEERDKVVAVK